MKKYIVFGTDQYYPMGGLDDIEGDFDSLEKARECVSKGSHDWYSIIDRDTWEEVQ